MTRLVHAFGAVEWLVWSPHVGVIERVERRFLQNRRIPVALGVALIVEGGATTPARIRELAEGRSAAAVQLDLAVNTDERMTDALTRAMVGAGFGVDAASGPLAAAHALVDGFLAAPAVDAAFQPLVSLQTGKVVGYEVLARPAAPIGELIRAGVMTDRAVELDLAILPRLLERIAQYPGIIASVNLLPASLLDPRFSKDELVRACRRVGLNPEQLTIECTEQQVVTDVDGLAAGVADLRRAGFSFAVDDAGAGHSSVALIARLRPNTIKIDRSFVTNVHRDGAHQAVIEAFGSFARRIGGRLVAEGVESEAELSELISLGVDIGQGYLLGRPAEAPGPTADTVASLRSVEVRTLEHASHKRRIGDLAVRAETADVAVNGETVRRRFNEDLELTCIVIVDAAYRPIAALARDRVMRRFSGAFGYAVYANRPAIAMADLTLRTVRSDELFIDVAMITTARDHASLHDDIVVVDEGGVLVGHVPVRELMRALTTVAVDLARDVNPLTGLPGNRRIQEVLSKAIVAGEPIVISHLDLDFFKTFNDLVGFSGGDDAIHHFAQALNEAGTRQGAIFVGHVGGDDFVVVWSNADDCRAGVLRVSDTFRRIVAGPASAACGGTHRSDADLSFSAASVVVRPGLDLETLATMIAELKRDAKARGGGRHVLNDAAASHVEILPGHPSRTQRVAQLAHAG